MKEEIIGKDYGNSIFYFEMVSNINKAKLSAILV